jgi:hypothetical protein
LFALFLLGGSLGGCASTDAKLRRGNAFATAGIAYVDALPAILDESFDLSVAANSLTLSQARTELTQQERIDRLKINDALLKQRLSLLADIRQHALILRSYFIALKTFTETDNATDISNTTIGLIESLADLHPKIANATIGGISLQELISPVVRIAVAQFQSRLLTRELNAHGQAIERELALQEAFMQALVEDMRANADLVHQVEELNPVFDAFVGSGKLPSDWKARRIAAFRSTSEIANLDDAQQAAANLHDTWIAFLEKRTTSLSFDLLIEDIEQMLALTQLFTSNSSPP